MPTPKSTKKTATKKVVAKKPIVSKVTKKEAAKKKSAITATKKPVTKMVAIASVKNNAARRSTKTKGKKVTTKIASADARHEPLLAAARIAVKDCMDVRAGETVTIITDENKRNIGVALWQATKELGAEAMLAEMTPRSRNGEEPPAPIAALMAASSVVLCPTTKSVTHTEARRQACARGARIATLPGITEDMMIRCLSADYQAIAARSRKLSDELQRGDLVRVTSPAGTDITLRRGDRYPKPDTGLYHEAGNSGNLPAGETFFAPIEGSAQGHIVFEAAVAGIGKLQQTIHIVVRDGMAVEITGGSEAEKLNELVDSVGPDGRNLAELGIGTNDQAQITGVILEDEKVMGTVHFALGDNKSMGGTVAVSSHLDGLILQPTVYVDGRMIMEAGKLLV